MDIADFLTARYDEAEKAVRANGHLADGWADPPPRWGPSHAYLGAPIRPKRDDILTDLASKRAIQWMHTGQHECPSVEDNCGWWVADDCPTLLLLAQPFADHPDYDPAWAVAVPLVTG